MNFSCIITNIRVIFIIQNIKLIFNFIIVILHVFLFACITLFLFCFFFIVDSCTARRFASEGSLSFITSILPFLSLLFMLYNLITLHSFSTLLEFQYYVKSITYSSLITCEVPTFWMSGLGKVREDASHTYLDLSEKSLT